MDFTSKNMYDTFKDEIWKELGPLDPDWFEALTAQTFINERNVSDQDDLRANPEGNFKPPLDKSAADSQLFSTPKVFRRNRAVSPETEDEQWFTAEQEKEILPWMPTQSPCFFPVSKEGIPAVKYGDIQCNNQDSFDLLRTPQKSPVSYANHISESLGAQTHHDMSWTSSLNTPPAVPSTLILTKTDENPSPLSVPADSNVIFVRKLFPSLSNASRLEVMSPKNNDVPTVQQGIVSPEACLNPESHNSPLSPLNRSDSGWRQTLPDAIEDEEIRSTVATVLDGAENVLSVFFTSSNSALRKVKTDRIKRRQIIPMKEHGCNSTDISTNNTAFSQQKAADQELGRSSPPLKTGDTGTTQWSPLSLSEIPPCTSDVSIQDDRPATQIENNISTQQLRRDSNSCQLIRTPMKITDSGVKKKRKFIYTVGTLKPQIQGKDSVKSPMMDSSAGILDTGQKVNLKVPDEADCCSIKKNEMQKHRNLTKENVPLSVQAKVQDLDMSQLCRDFAQDFSQMSDLGTLSKVAEDIPRDGFSPSACLSAMKREKWKARQAHPRRDCDNVSDGRSISTTSENISIRDSTISDSGFQSAVPDITQITSSSFVLPSSENNGKSQWTSFKTDNYGTAPFPSTNKGDVNAHLNNILQAAETDTEPFSKIKESHTMGSGGESELHTESTSTDLPSSLPSFHASGFKTASNSGKQISSASLERVKRLFEETEQERISSDKPTKCARDTKEDICMSRASVKNTTSNSNQPPASNEKNVVIDCQLTASQKADVTELCTLMEEADSQFEFTQFKAAKPQQQQCQDIATSPHKIDPDFLTGIDFDDSFNSDAEKRPAVPVYDKATLVSGCKTNCKTFNVTHKSTGLSLSSVTKKENSSIEDVLSSSKHISQGRGSIMSAEPKHLDRAGHTETSKVEDKTALMLGVGFKTAGGNVLRVSKKCLSKARALFADIEENLVTSQKSALNQSTETEVKKQHKLSVDNCTGHFYQRKDHLKATGYDNTIGARIKSTEESSRSDRQITGSRDEDAAKYLSKMNTTSCQNGFQMASGKGISVSAKAMQEADAFFKDCEVMDSNVSMSRKQSKSTERLPGSISHKKKCQEFKNVKGTELPISEFEFAEPAVHQTEYRNTPSSTNVASFQGNSSSTAKAYSSLSCLTSKNIVSLAINEFSSGGGFCTASGKKVTVSDDAMKKAECLLNENHTLEDTNEQLKQKGGVLKTGHLTKLMNVSPPKNGGFQTASGKGVTISSAALKKAKLLLTECSEDKIALTPAQSKVPVHGQPPRNHGFHAASGKPVMFSCEALQKAKACFSEGAPAVSDKRKSDKKQNNPENTEIINCGFTTAGGAKVHVSQKNLLKARKLLKDFDDASVSVEATQDTDTFFKACDIMDGNSDLSVKKSIEPVRRNGSEKKPLSKSKQDQMETVNISEHPGSTHTECENVNVGPVVSQEKVLHHDKVDINGGVFKNKLDRMKAVSLQGAPSLMVESQSSLLCPTSENTGSFIFNELSNGGGFCTASGKKVSVSDDAMTKAKSLFSESTIFEDPNKQLKQREDTLPPQNSGFQTASGKGVAISSAALKKAKTLLSECEGVAAEIGVKPAGSKMPVAGPPMKNPGFLAASGKPVAFSSAALQEVKALFSDISFSAETEAVSDISNSDNKHKDTQHSTEKIHFGFTTAGGAKVHVSQKNLLKAKNLLKEFADGEFHDSNSSSPHGAQKSDQSKVKNVKTLSNLSTSSDKEIPAKEDTFQSLGSLQETFHENNSPHNSSTSGCIFIKDKASTDAFEFKSGVGNLPKEEDVSSMLDYGVIQTDSGSSKGKRMEESSVLNFHTLNLSGCTETQHKFLAQEALDCTKALLEDESVAGQSLSMTLDNDPVQDYPKPSNRFVDEQKGRGKRMVEDQDITGQPPLKRRLLEEFDRTVEGARSSTLDPEKSCPNALMKDRRVFQYSVSLHPNITRPQRNGNYVDTRLQKTTPTQHSILGESRSAHRNVPAFVPPFLKNAKTEGQKLTVIKNSIRTPPAFVPPFKKQRTVVQESSSKPQEDKHPFVMPFNCKTYAPPTKKTQSITDGTGNKSKDTQTVPLADTTNDNVMNNQNAPVDCESEDLAAQASRVEDTLSGNQDISQNLHNIELARDMQDMRIRKKKRQTIRPLPGSLFLTKTSGVSRISLKAAVNGKAPVRYTKKQLYGHGVHHHVYEITSETAESFRFSLQQFVKLEAFIDGGGVQLADGGWLIPSNDGSAGKEEFYRALCDTPGVDPKLISEEWVYNHYRWIVWKQASMERSFPETMGSLCLTPEQVLLQLKYRYDVEVDHSRRPALRKIMERDDTAAKTLVLCVCGVVSRGHSPKRQSFLSGTKTPPGADAKAENPCAVIWLTDGWYSIKAQLDEPLTAMLHEGRLAVGGKLIVHGAQLVGSQDACSPLEAPESLMLKICANSSRPTRWDTKLGFHKDPRPFLLPVSCLYSNGGPVGCVDIVILRSYPIQWMERKPDGGIVFRSARAEEKEERRYSSQKQKAMEILFAKIQAEFEKEEKGNNKPQRRRRTISRQDIASLHDGEELNEAVGDDPVYLEAHLSVQQLETLHSYRRSLMEKKQAELQDRYRRALETAENSEGSCPKRDVTPVWRLCIADSMDQSSTVYQLSLWRPTLDLQSLLKEGCRYKVYNLTTSDGKKHGGNTTVQLTGTKKTQFQDLQASREWLSTHFEPRVSTHFMDLQNSEFQPLCGEVDLTGYIISIVDGQGSSPAFYLVDGKMNFVKVRCFSSLAQSGLEDVIKPRVLLALSNLQLRGQSTSPTPVVYAGDLTVYSTNPKEVHLQESLSQLRNLIQSQENFFQTAEETLSHLVKSDGVSSISSPAVQTKTPASVTDKRRDTKTSATSQQPVRSLGSFTPLGRNPPAANGSTGKDPSSLKRKRALEYLSRIPSPPPLSILGSVASPCVNKTFNPPRRSGTPSTLKTVQTPARKPVDSPVEDEWVNDEELAMIDTQALLVGDLL